MNARPLWVALAGSLVGCGVNRPIQQTVMTQLREQDSLVMAPEAPMGIGASLPAGASSLAFGGAFTSVQPLGEGPGEQILPLSALLRGAVAAGEGVDISASGSLGSPDVDLGPVAPGVDGLSGVLARGAVGVRAFLPLRGEVEWGWSLDLGAEATHLVRTDTVVRDVRDRQGISSTEDVHRSYGIRVHPHTRFGTVVRVPTGFGFAALAGAQLQTWPSYWSAKSQTDTCTLWLNGERECVTTGSIDGPASRLVAALTPSLGASLAIGGAALHLQGFAHLGDQAVQRVPWGAMVMIERVFSPAEAREAP